MNRLCLLCLEVMSHLFFREPTNRTTGQLRRRNICTREWESTESYFIELHNNVILNFFPHIFYFYHKMLQFPSSEDSKKIVIQLFVVTFLEK